MNNQTIKQGFIVTSYFAQQKALKAVGYYIISIARYNPRYLSCASYKALAPSPGLLHDWRTYHDKEHYTEVFNHFLHHFCNAEQVLQDLLRYSGGQPIALCCYERSTDFCHRHLVADWMNKELGIQIEEFQS